MRAFQKMAYLRSSGGAGGGGATPDLSDMPLIARTTTVEGGVVTLDGLDLTDYQAIFASIEHIRADTDDTDIQVRLIVDGVVRNSGYRYILKTFDSADVDGSANSQAATGIALTGNISNVAGQSASWDIMIGNADAALYKLVSLTSRRFTSDPRMHLGQSGAVLEHTGTLDGLQIVPTNGLITEVSLAVYGIKKGSRTPGDPALQSLWVGALT